MRNIIPRHAPLESRKKNHLDMGNLFFLNNSQLNNQTKSRVGDSLDTKIIDRVREELKTEPYKELIRDAFGDDTKREKLRQEVTKIVSSNDFTEEYKNELKDRKLNQIVSNIIDKIVGLDVLESLRKSPTITDISVNGYDNIWVDDIYKGQYKLDLKFDSEQAYEELLLRLAFASDKVYTYGTPSFDAIFPSIRINVVGHDLSKKPTLQMRLISRELRINKDYIAETEYLNQLGYDILKMTFPIKSHLISGETGTGKTEAMRYFTRYSKPRSTIIMIEDTPESYLDELYPNDKFNIKMWQNREQKGEIKTEFGYGYHLRNAMRQNPDYINLQESRGEEALFVLKAVTTGHIVNTTLHSKSAKGSVERFIDLCQEGQMQDGEIYGKRITSEDGFGIGVHIERFGKTRKINEIMEFTGYKNGEAQGNMLLKYNPLTGKHEVIDRMSERLWNELSKYHSDMSPLAELSPYKAVAM